MESSSTFKRIDKELFSELDDSPINPAFIHISIPPVESTDQDLGLQINGDGLWSMRGFWRNEQRISGVLQDSLLQFGYRLISSASARISSILRDRILYLTRKARNISNSKNSRAFRSNYWTTIAIECDEIAAGPKEVSSRFLEKERELAKERKELEGKVYKYPYFSIFFDRVSMSLYVSFKHLLFRCFSKSIQTTPDDENI
jgi:hypothetical protein